MKKKYSHILWDFNGTLLDDVYTGILSINPMLECRGLNTISSIEQYRNAFTFPIRDYYKNVGLDLNTESFNDLADEWMKNYIKYSGNAALFPNTESTLAKIKSLGIKQYILSATEQNMLIKQTKALKIYDFFDGIMGLNNILAESKVSIAKKFNEDVHPKNVLFIGDTIHDYDTATEIKADCILINSGHQNLLNYKDKNLTIFKDITSILDIL